MPVVEYPQGSRFPGRIGLTTADSSPAWPEPIRAPEGAPNVLFFVLDDVGYGQLSTFGGLVETPNIDRVAAMGLRFANMHTTALCSPTRSCILTGRNHHSQRRRLDHGDGHRLSRLRRADAVRERHAERDLARRGLQHVLCRQVAPEPSRGQHARGSLPSLAGRTRLRALLRIPRRRDQPVVSGPHRGQPRGRTAQDARAGLSPQ